VDLKFAASVVPDQYHYMARGLEASSRVPAEDIHACVVCSLVSLYMSMRVFFEFSIKLPWLCAFKSYMRAWYIHLRVCLCVCACESSTLFFQACVCVCARACV
jgi:hypothetical protein